MKIACLGWGSLIWNPGNLQVKKQWCTDGPVLPVEFARQSNNGRLTLVITPEAIPVPTLWSLMTTKDLDIARESLREREGIGPKSAGRFIGLVVAGLPAPADAVSQSVASWMYEQQLDAVLWTHLPPKFNGRRIAPTVTEALHYLSTLEGEQASAAVEYIRRAPAQIATRYRTAIEAELGWTTSGS